ncbi:MAG: hypothetical protein ACHQ52_05865 [Candidatus Eisenbacteria bacterium]
MSVTPESSSTARSAAFPGSTADVLVDGSVIVYRQYDVGWEIALDRAEERLAARSPQRARPVRAEAQTLRIANPPLDVNLGTETIALAGQTHAAEATARVFDFAVISLRLAIRLPRGLAWPVFADVGNRMGLMRDLTPVFERHLGDLLAAIAPAVARPRREDVTEDYVVFRVDALRDADGRPVPPQCLGDHELARLLLDERQPLSEAARRELLPHRFAYTVDDLAVLTWNDALVIEPVPDDEDVQYLLEFANAQLLELRVLDTLLDRDLPSLTTRVAAMRGGPGALLGRRFAPLLANLQTRMADIIEVVERVENSLKVTDDVYLARIYSAALEIFRGRAWRAGIDRKMGLLRDTYTVLSAEAQAARAEALEVAIVVLIVVEIVLGLLRR